MDTDVVLKSNIEVMLKQVDILLPQVEPNQDWRKQAPIGIHGLHVANWFMASVPHHPFWLYVMEQSIIRINRKERKYPEKVLVMRTTGPFMLGECVLDKIRDRNISLGLFCIGEKISQLKTTSSPKKKKAGILQALFHSSSSKHGGDT